MNTLENKQNQENDFDRILSKYISIWIWSILFGGTATITLTLLNTVPRGRDWSSLSYLFIAILLYGLFFLLMSWLSLYKYLISYILPKFFPKEDQEEYQEEELRKYQLNKSSFYLRRSFLYFIGGIVAIFAMKIAELFIGSLY